LIVTILQEVMAKTMFWRLGRQCDLRYKGDLHSTQVERPEMKTASHSPEDKELLWDQTVKEVFTFTVVGLAVVVGR
jgi:hypothetical protein